ncbi:MAG: tetratricopeptide repeat protein [Pseudomonadales bacterium]|nr:tetratricopeptide repeat protein [Pseudomonadales bacterium]
MITAEQRTQYLTDANVRLNKGDTMGAMQHYQRLLDANKRDAAAYAGFGIARALRQEYPEAIKCYINALRIEQQSRWLLDLAIVYLHSKETIAARSALALCGGQFEGELLARWTNTRQVADERYNALLIDQLAPHPLTLTLREMVLALAPAAAAWEADATSDDIASMAASMQARDYTCAIGTGLRILARKPEHSGAINNIGVCFKRLLEYPVAYDIFCFALRLFPTDVTLLSNAGNVLCEAGVGNKALNFLEFASVLAPDDGLLWGNLSVAYHQARNHPRETERTARKALKLMPGQANIINNLANALKDRQDHKGAIELYRQAIEMTPEDPLPFHNYLLALQYADGFTADEVAREHQRFGALFEPLYRSQHGNYLNVPTPSRPLRVGFVSPDLRSHSVAYFAEPLWAGLPRDEFHIIAYQCMNTEDSVSARLKQYCVLWRNVTNLNDDKLAAQIRADEIDILVDLAGHTGRNRLLVFARKPAPVQLTWLGHPNTTGLKAIDWRLTDAIGDPPEVDHRYSEKLWRLSDAFVVYRPLIKTPELLTSDKFVVQPTPALKNGYITFGCCNNQAKITAPVVALWSRLLQELPTAKILIEAPGLQQAQFRAELTARFTAHGVGQDQIIALGRDHNKQYLRYNEIDIALDPFPCNGGTTTCDLLWMGVPLVTMPGEGFMSRMGASLVSAAGHPEWVVPDAESYLARAKALASDVDALNRHRLQARAEIERSPLRDEERFARHVATAFRTMWKQWCEEQA